MTDTAHDRQFSTFAPAAAPVDGAFARAFGWLSGRPVVIAVAGVVVLSGLGWIALGIITTRMAEGPLADALRDALCLPGFGHSHFGTAPAAMAELGLVAAMWCAMVLAMMLPTAGPMIVTYAEIADAAVRKGESIVSPLVLMAGYVAVWLGFAFTASVLQMALGRAAANPLSAGVVLFAAGLYQFSTLKQACVRHCQRPFPYLFAHWSDHTAGVFRLGLRQGLYCLGCCWAMMAVMLAVGAMNVAWMAVLGLVMGLEKTTTTMRFSRGVGAVLMTAGLAYIVLGSLS